MNTDLFQSCGDCWVLPTGWRRVQHFQSIIFQDLKHSAGVSSPSLGFCIVMLPKAQLTLYSRMSGSRRVTTPSWLSGSLRPFLYSSVYSCHLLISSAVSVLYWAHLCMKYSVHISNFLEISGLSHSVVFFCFFAVVHLEPCINTLSQGGVFYACVLNGSQSPAEVWL